METPLLIITKIQSLQKNFKPLGKIILANLLQKLQRGGHKVLVLSQMVCVLDFLEDLFRVKHSKYERPDGSKSALHQAGAIDRFCHMSYQIIVMILGTRAGGMGLDLPTADRNVIFYNDWKPQLRTTIPSLFAQNRQQRPTSSSFLRVLRVSSVLRVLSVLSVLKVPKASKVSRVSKVLRVSRVLRVSSVSSGFSVQGVSCIFSISRVFVFWRVQRVWTLLSLFSVLSVDLGRLFAFLSSTFNHRETKKQDWKNTQLFLVTDRLDRYLAWIPVHPIFISHITISIIVNNCQYINSSFQLKYCLLIRKLLDATH